MDAFLTSIVLPVVRYWISSLHLSVSRPLLVLAKQLFPQTPFRIRPYNTHLHVVPENLLHLRHPAHIQRFSHIRKLGVLGRADKRAVFGTEAHILDVAPVLLEEIAITARYEIDDIFRVGGELADGRKGALGGDCLRGDFNDGRQGALYICQRLLFFVVRRDALNPGVIVHCHRPHQPASDVAPSWQKGGSSIERDEKHTS